MLNLVFIMILCIVLLKTIFGFYYW